MSTLRVTQVRGLANQGWRHRLCIQALGLRGINSSAVLENTPSIRGQIKKVIHLVEVQEIEETNG